MPTRLLKNSSPAPIKGLAHGLAALRPGKGGDIEKKQNSVQVKSKLTTSNPLTRRYDVKLITSLGFGLVIGILLISIVGSYHTTNSHNQLLSQLVRAAGMKTVLAYTMREAIRERIDSLRAMATQTDPFKRDEEKMRFFSHGS